MPPRVAHILAAFLIASVGALAYANSLTVPFQLDDPPNIVYNPVITDLKYFLHPSMVTASPGGRFAPRIVAYFTFALNYKLHGLRVEGYHAFNIALHVANALFLYAIVLILFRSPRLRDSRLSGRAPALALLAALLFVAHPIQTAAVTYIVQRLTVLLAFFYLLSVLAYLAYRSASGGVRRGSFYALLILSALLAMKTKELAVTIPFTILLVEFVFYEGGRARRLAPIIPIVLLCLIVPLSALGAGTALPDLASGLGGAARQETDLARSTYLFTQFGVVATYLRLFFLPINQNLDYDYPLNASFFLVSSLLPFMFLLGIGSLGVFFCIRRGPLHDSASALIGFCILWFFLTLSVESSFIPIRDVIFEHRVYLPSVGISIGVVTAVFLGLDRMKGATLTIASSVMVLIFPVLLVLTIARNQVWGTEASLWEDAASKSPNKTRPHLNLGVAYDTIGLRGKAIGQFRSALAIEPQNEIAHNELGAAYAKDGKPGKAIEHMQLAVAINPGYTNAHLNLGTVYMGLGNKEGARREFEAVLRLNPGEQQARMFLVYLDSLP